MSTLYRMPTLGSCIKYKEFHLTGTKTGKPAWITLADAQLAMIT